MKFVESARSIDEFTPFMDGRYYTGDVYCGVPKSRKAHFRLETVQAGTLPLASYAGNGIGLRRSWKHIREHTSELFVLWFPKAGDISVTQDLAADVRCSPGSFTITYGNRPLHVRSSHEQGEECQQIHLLVPSHILRSRLPNIDRQCGRVFSCTAGASVAQQIVSSVLAQSDDMSADCRSSLGMAALDAVCDTIRRMTADEPVTIDTKKAHIERVLRYIDNHLPTQGLTAERVASGCNISRRYLHYLLQEHETSFGEYLWEARLRQAKAWLHDPEFQHFNVVDIAYMCGFRSASHFSNSYRQRYGASPSTARARPGGAAAE